MAEPKTGPLPVPQFGGAGAGAKPLAPTVPLVKADKRFLPRPPKRKHAFNRSATAFTKGRLAFPG
jgi:hypothetical protein